MSMSTSVYGIRPADEAYRAMESVWKACTAAKVPIPKPVLDFFNGVNPDPSGVLVDIEEHPAVSKWSDPEKDGFEVDLTKLDPTIKKLRFVNNW